MPNPQFTKPWHGVPQEQTYRNPTVIDALCESCIAADHVVIDSFGLP